MENPRVFISYSQDNEEHKAWVLKLATDLRSHGVDAILDQFDLRLGQDLRFFMEHGLSSSALVLCVCSQKYVEKVNAGIGGAGYEGMIMTQSLLKNANMDYIISIIRNNQSEQKVPLSFGSKTYIDFNDDNLYFVKYRELLMRIYGEDAAKKPPLGKNPFSTEMGQAIETKTKIESALYHTPALDGHVVFRYDNNNGIYTIGTGEYQFDTRWSGCGPNAIYAIGSVGVQLGAKEFPEYRDIVNFDFTSRTRTLRTGQVAIIKNHLFRFAAVKIGQVKASSHGASYDELEFEYHIYCGE